MSNPITASGYVIHNGATVYGSAQTREEAEEQIEAWLARIPEEMERPEIAPATAALIAEVEDEGEVWGFGELDGVFCTNDECDEEAA